MTAAATLPDRLAALAAAAALGLALAAGPAAAQDEGAAEGTEDAAAEAGMMEMDELTAETVIATVGDYELTLGELISVRQALPQQYQSLPPTLLVEGLVEQLINQTVLAERARTEELDERVDVEMTLRNQMSSALADAYMRDEMRRRVTMEAVEAAYEERYADAEPLEEIRARHILVETEEKAQELRQQIEEGASFEELAAEHGTDGTAQRGGDLGYFVQGDMVPEFADAAFAMEVGEVSEPVQTPFGWHLIKLEDRRDRPTPTLEEAREQLLEELATEAQQAIVAEAKEQVSVTRPDKTLPPAAILADDLIAPPSAGTADAAGEAAAEEATGGTAE